MSNIPQARQTLVARILERRGHCIARPTSRRI
jgi:hypothetical protein